jgi:hypothetical protein
VEAAGERTSGAHVTPIARTLSLLVIACAACSSQNPSPSAGAETAAPRSSGADVSQPPAAEVRPSDLRGTWVEYWAVDGGADTERYSFSELGRFEWNSSYSAQTSAQAPRTAVRKAGVFRLERDGSTAVLVLEIQHEAFAGCSAPCTGSAEPREVDHGTPLVERYELGECPSNPEAQRVDANYACRAFGGKAFWRKVDEPRAASKQSSTG